MLTPREYTIAVTGGTGEVILPFGGRISHISTSVPTGATYDMELILSTGDAEFGIWGTIGCSGNCSFVPREEWTSGCSLVINNASLDGDYKVMIMVS